MKIWQTHNWSLHNWNWHNWDWKSETQHNWQLAKLILGIIVPYSNWHMAFLILRIIETFHGFTIFHQGAVPTWIQNFINFFCIMMDFFPQFPLTFFSLSNFPSYYVFNIVLRSIMINMNDFGYPLCQASKMPIIQ